MPFVVAAPAVVIAAIGGFMALFGLEPGYFSGIVFGLGTAMLLVITGRAPVQRVSPPSWVRTVLIGVVCAVAVFSVGWSALGPDGWATALVGGAACAIADRRVTLSKAARNLHRGLLIVVVLAAAEALWTQPIIGLAALTGAGAGVLFPVELFQRRPKLAPVQSEGSEGYGNEVLAIAAFLDAKDIPKSLVRETAKEMGVGRATSLGSLATAALLDVGPDSWQARPMVQEFARKRMLEVERKAWAARTVSMLTRHFPQHPKAGDALCERLVPHVLAAVEHAEDLDVERAAAAVLLDRVAEYLTVVGRVQEAQVMRERAIAHASVGFGESSAEVATLHSHMVRGRAAASAAASSPDAESLSSSLSSVSLPSVLASSSSSSSTPSLSDGTGVSGPGGSAAVAEAVGGADAEALGGSEAEALGGAEAAQGPGAASGSGAGAGRGQGGVAGSRRTAAVPPLSRLPIMPVGMGGLDPTSFSTENGYSRRSALAFSFAQTGDVRLDAGDIAGARRDYRAALSSARFSLPRSHPLVVDVRARLAALPQPARDEDNERRLVIGCFSLVVATVLICVGFTVVRDLDESRSKPSDKELTSTDQLVEVCNANQRYFRDAAAFAGDEPHPAQVFVRGTNDTAFKRELFGGDVDPRRTQLVACASQTKTGPPVTTCRSSTQPEIPLHEAIYQVTIYETWTGRRLGSFTLTADKGQCPASYPAPPQGKPWMLYATPSDDQYRQALQPVLDLLPTEPTPSASSH